jgi:hypothetical protein
MATDPIARLEFAQREIDRVFGDGFAREHSDLTAAVMLSASMDWAAMTIAAALVVEDEPAVGTNGGLTRLWRP